LVAHGERVLVLTRTDDAANAAEALGATPVRGDLLARGAWQDEVARADRVVHLAQPETFGRKVTRARAVAYREARLQMDEHLLAAASGARRVLYVAGTSYYGH